MSFARTRRPVSTLLLLGSVLAFQACSTPAPPLAPAEPVDGVVIARAAHTLTLLAQGKPLRTYRVALGRGSGPKQQEGDARTPEGLYQVDGKNPHSHFHLALHLSYPNAADVARATAMHVRPGSDVEIHGLPAAAAPLGHLQHTLDWTSGCIALSDAEMDEVYRLVPVGTAVEIKP